MAALLWFAGAVLLAGAEALTGDFFLLMLAGGALGTAGFALADFPIWIDAIFFALLSLTLILGLRPALLRRFSRPPELMTNTPALEGKTATVLQEISGGLGRIKLSGEVWTARAMNKSDTYIEGETVRVYEIDGATAVVYKEL
ncbi:NfeD family protein [Tomitella biformata]|uniref:NfeD family protein n=1 Tax=Tomitella biformata TaxID=630403 RepID=UPI000467254E|nr:NfeD family protein [Tomitella biformata]